LWKIFGWSFFSWSLLLSFLVLFCCCEHDAQTDEQKYSSMEDSMIASSDVFCIATASWLQLRLLYLRLYDVSRVSSTIMNVHGSPEPTLLWRVLLMLN
jgi:hypothetical protein